MIRVIGQTTTYTDLVTMDTLSQPGRGQTEMRVTFTLKVVTFQRAHIYI